MILALVLLARIYHPMAIPALAAEQTPRRTHVEIVGFLTYSKKEADGDRHLRICDSPDVKGMDRARCIVAECIPALPCLTPRVGERVKVRGITRFDGENGHKWLEVHPVEFLEVVP